MFGLDFLFLSALIGLPLVGLPILLHLLSRSKSTIVLFSTTRFIQSSIQQTAARKKLQKWLLLVIRMLLLLLLILLAAQPAKRLAATLGGSSAIAAIVVDTSYSMQVQSGNVSLTQRADEIVGSLLRNELSNAKISVYRSQTDAASETLQSAGNQLAHWQANKVEVSSKPLIDRIEAARKMLENQQAGSKWLIVISDGQSREFPRLPEAWTEGQTVFFDLHPDSVRSSGITQLSIDPYPPLPGISEEAVIKIEGNHDSSRAVTLAVSTLDGKTISTSPPKMIGASEKGESEIRIPFTMPPEAFIKLTAKVEGEDDLALDNLRESVVQSLTRQNVRLVNATGHSGRFIRLAIDPTEGRAKDWPLGLRLGGSIQNDDQVIVEILNDWPSVDQANTIKQFVDQGKKAVLFIRPGLETKWNTLPEDQKQALLSILPGTPAVTKSSARSYQAIATSDSATLMKELIDPRYQLGSISISRYVPIERTPLSTALLAISSSRGSTNNGLLYRQPIGRGMIYTFTTLPDAQFSSLASHPLFLPMVVNACLPDAATGLAHNGTVGDVLKLSRSNNEKLTISTPAGEPFAVEKNAAGFHEFNRTSAPGIYIWKSQTGQVISAASIQPPANESNLNYRPANSLVTGENVTIARNLDEFHSQVMTITQPQPKWSPVIAVLLLLLCAETLLGNHSGLWKLIGR